jgi:hypothetical protein
VKLVNFENDGKRGVKSFARAISFVGLLCQTIHCTHPPEFAEL